MMLDALGVLLGGLGRNPDGAQQVDHKAVAEAYAGGERMARIGQKNATVRPGDRQSGAPQSSECLDRGGMGDPQTSRDVGRTRLSAGGQEVVDQFGIVFQQGACLRRAGLAEARAWVGSAGMVGRVEASAASSVAIGGSPDAESVDQTSPVPRRMSATTAPR